MKTKVFELFPDFEKEEHWLNTMAAKGWNLTGVFCNYHFEEGLPGEYIYRVVLLEHMPSHPETISNIRIMEETGAELVCTYYRWAYFRRKAEYGDFQIYTDALSQIAHYKRVIRLISWAAVGAFIGFAIQIPLIICAIFIWHEPFGFTNVIAAVFVAVCLYWVYMPWFRFRKKVKDLEFERDIFE